MCDYLLIEGSRIIGYITVEGTAAEALWLRDRYWPSASVGLMVGTEPLPLQIKKIMPIIDTRETLIAPGAENK